MNINIDLTKKLETIILENRIINENNCWIWKGKIAANGYGQIEFIGFIGQIHRIISYLYLDLDNHKDLCVLHNCDNPLCFNPEHLRLGTRVENNKDKCERNRQAKGFSIRGKLTEEDIREIRNHWNNKEFSMKELSEIYDVKVCQIGRIINGKQWKHII